MPSTTAAMVIARFTERGSFGGRTDDTYVLGAPTGGTRSGEATGVPMVVVMDGTRSWRGRIGAALSFSALGFAIASLVGPPGRACPTPEGSTSLDLTPLLL